jgi:hypothetical protein
MKNCFAASLEYFYRQPPLFIRLYRGLLSFYSAPLESAALPVMSQGFQI